MESLQAKIDRGDIIILDAAISSEIERRGGRMTMGSWSGATNLSHPDVGDQSHRGRTGKEGPRRRSGRPARVDRRFHVCRRRELPWGQAIR